MKRSRFTEHQINSILKEIERAPPVLRADNWGQSKIYFEGGFDNLNVCNWPTTEISGTEIHSHFCSAMWRQPGIHSVEELISLVDPMRNKDRLLKQSLLSATWGHQVSGPAITFG